MRSWISFLLFASIAFAGPVDFGMTELNAAIDARNFKYKPKIMAELDIEAPETFRIEPYAAGGAHITGGDLRGLMYGLLEAADQMRATGRLKQTRGNPLFALRGVRITANTQATWFASPEFWQRYFMDLARARFNRLELAFDAAPGPDTLPPVRVIAQIAQQYGVDLAFGFTGPNSAIPNSAVPDLLANCPTVHAVVFHGNVLPDAADLLPVLRDSGRRVVLELPDNESSAGLIEATGRSGAPLRLFSPYMGATVNPRPRDWYLEMNAAQDVDAIHFITGGGFVIGAALDETGRPVLDPIAVWGRSGYTRP